MFTSKISDNCSQRQLSMDYHFPQRRPPMSATERILAGVGVGPNTICASTRRFTWSVERNLDGGDERTVGLLIFDEGYIRRTRSSGVKYRWYFTNSSATHGLSALFETWSLEGEGFAFTTWQRHVTHRSTPTSIYARNTVATPLHVLVDLPTCSRACTSDKRRSPESTAHATTSISRGPFPFSAGSILVTIIW